MTSSLKVLSYNIHKGFSTGNRSFILTAIRDAIRSTGADLVFLQEVVGQHDRHQQRLEAWPNEAQFEYLADSLWSHFAYGRNAVYTGGHHGNAILSRYPIQATDNIDLSTNRFEQRGLLHTIIKVPDWPHELHALCTHLNLTAGGRGQQRDKIVSRIQQNVPVESPLILAGDFNEWGSTSTHYFADHLTLIEAHRTLHGYHARTFPSIFPVLALDRIYFRGFRPRSAQALNSSPWGKLSDHGALWAELEIARVSEEP